MWQSFCGKVAWSNTNVCDDFVQKMTEDKSCKYGDYGSFEDLGPTIKVLARCLGLPSRCWPGVLAYHQGAGQVSWPTIKVLARCLGLPSRCWPGVLAYHQGAGQVSWPTIKVLARCLGLPSRCWPGVLAYHQGAGQVSCWRVDHLRILGLPSRCWAGVLAYHQGAGQVSCWWVCHLRHPSCILLTYWHDPGGQSGLRLYGASTCLITPSLGVWGISCK